MFHSADSLSPSPIAFPSSLTQILQPTQKVCVPLSSDTHLFATFGGVEVSFQPDWSLSVIP